MSENLQETPGLTVTRTRVYFDPETGQVVHVHRVASAGPLADDQLQDELDAFAASVQQRHGRELDSIDVEETELAASFTPDTTPKVDVAARRLTLDS
jgi:hypothetical protein